MAGQIKQVLKGQGVRAFWNPLKFTTPTTVWPTSGQHQQAFVFFGVPNGSVITLWVNGKSTTMTYSSTPATTVTNLSTALGTLSGVGMSGSHSAGIYTMTFLVHVKYFHVKIVSQPTSGYVDTYIVTPGAQTFDLRARLTSYKSSAQIETTDVTPVMQVEEDTEVQKSTLTFSLSLYNVSGEWLYALYPQAEGTLTVFENYQRKGSQYVQFYALIEAAERETTPGSVQEIIITGRRKGVDIAPFGSIY